VGACYCEAHLPLPASSLLPLPIHVTDVHFHNDRGSETVTTLTTAGCKRNMGYENIGSVSSPKACLLAAFRRGFTWQVAGAALHSIRTQCQCWISKQRARRRGTFFECCRGNNHSACRKSPHLLPVRRRLCHHKRPLRICVAVSDAQTLMLPHYLTTTRAVTSGHLSAIFPRHYSHEHALLWRAGPDVTAW